MRRGIILVVDDRVEAIGPDAAIAATAPWHDLDELQVAVRHTCEALRARGVGVIDVQLARPLVQTRMLEDFPPMRIGMVRTIVARSATVFFRDRPGGIVTGASWRRHDGKDRVFAAAADRTMLQAVWQSIEGGGLRVRRVGLAEARARHERNIDLTPPDLQRQCRARRMQGMKEMAAEAVHALVVLGWVAAGILFWRATLLERRAAALDGVQKSLHTLAAEVRSTQVMVDALQGTYAAQGRVLSTLAGIAGAAPPDVSISGIRLNVDSTCVISGRSPQAARAMADLLRTSTIWIPPGEHVPLPTEGEGESPFTLPCRWNREA